MGKRKKRQRQDDLWYRQDPAHSWPSFLPAAQRSVGSGAGRASVASLDAVRAVFETNVLGVIAVTQAMLPLLRKAPAPRIVNVSSSAGSLTLNSNPTNPHSAMFGTYSLSKTALNAITVAFASDLESDGIKVNAACPGLYPISANLRVGV